MENIPLFIDRKHGIKPVSYPHPDLKNILENTYGVIVYQEQIMQIASTMAGFSLGEADLLRRAVGKKQKETLDRERNHFVQGALKRIMNRVWRMKYTIWLSALPIMDLIEAMQLPTVWLPISLLI